MGGTKSQPVHVAQHAATQAARGTTSHCDAVEAMLKGADIKFSRKGSTFRAPWTAGYALLVHVDTSRKLHNSYRGTDGNGLTTIIVTAEEPELRVPDSNHHDALLLIDKLNFEKLAIGKFQLDLSTGFVWISEVVRHPGLPIKMYTDQVLTLAAVLVETWKDRFAMFKGIVGTGPSHSGEKFASAQLVEQFFTLNDFGCSRSHPTAGMVAEEKAWQFLHKFGSPDDVIEAVTTVREYLPHYVIVSVRCSADTQPGSQSQSTVLAALTDFATRANFEVAVGGFTVDFNNSNKLFYEAELYFGGDEHSALRDYITVLFDSCLSTLLKYIPAARRTVQTNDAAGELAKMRKGSDAEDGLGALQALLQLVQALEGASGSGSGGGDGDGGKEAERPGLRVEELPTHEPAPNPGRGAGAPAASTPGSGGSHASSGSGRSAGRSAVISDDDLDYETDDRGNRVAFAAGGFGKVFKASYCGADVAVKEANGSFPERALQEFTKEANLLSSLSHPSIVQLMGLVASPTRCALVMDYAPLGSLDSYLGSSTASLNWAQKQSLAKDIAAGMMYLHSRQPEVLHLDMKPGNVLIFPGPRAKVCDFGLAHVKATATTHSIASPSQGQKDAVGGTLLFADPDQFMTPKATPAMDIWGVGTTLFHMFTGKMPFDHAPHILMAAGAEPALFIMAVKSGLRPEFPSDFGHDDLQTLIKSCWNEDAAARPTAAALFKRLREIAA